MRRRTLLQASLVQTALLGLVKPVSALAAYPIKAFSTREIPAALGELLGSSDTIDSDLIDIQAPPIARDASVVPVRISSGHDNTESISLVVERNPAPFTAYFRLYESQNHVSTRIRLNESSDLLVVVKADGQLYASRRRVRVGLSSCEA